MPITIAVLWAQVVEIEVPAAFGDYRCRMTARPGYRTAYKHTSSSVEREKQGNERMSKSHFLKDNLALIAGICLPVLLVLAFWIATAIPRMTVPAPRYDMIYTADYYDYNARVHGAVRLEVRDGTLRATFHSDDRHTYRSTPRIFYFDVSAGSIHEISIDIPGDLQDGQELNIPEADQYTLSKESMAPDGYSFDASYRGGHGFFFFGGGYRYRGTIARDGRAVKIPTHGNQYQGNLRFLGWVLEGGHS